MGVLAVRRSLKRFKQGCYNFAVDLEFFLEKLFVGDVAPAAVAVAQLVESGIVIPVVVGSSPIGHPKIHEHLKSSSGVFFRLRLTKFARTYRLSCALGKKLGEPTREGWADSTEH